MYELILVPSELVRQGGDSAQDSNHGTWEFRQPEKAVKMSLSNHPELRKVHCLRGILDSLVKKKASFAEPEPLVESREK